MRQVKIRNRCLTIPTVVCCVTSPEPAQAPLLSASAANSGSPRHDVLTSACDADDIDAYLEAEALALHDVTRSDVDEASEFSERSSQRPRFGHPPNVRVRTLSHETSGSPCTAQHCDRKALASSQCARSFQIRLTRVSRTTQPLPLSTTPSLPHRLPLLPVSTSPS